MPPHVVVHAAADGAALGCERGQDVVGTTSDAVGPVVEHQHPLGVIAAGFGRVVDDQRRVQAAIDLHATVRMEEVGARVRRREGVGVVRAGGDRLLGDARDAIGGVVQPDAVPVDAGLDRKRVAHPDLHDVTGLRPQFGTRNPSVVAPRTGGHPAEVDRRHPGAQCRPDGRGAEAGRNGDGDGHGRPVTGGAAAEQGRGGQAEAADDQLAPGEAMHRVRCAHRFQPARVRGGIPAGSMLFR